MGAVQSGEAQASQGFCWGDPECTEMVATRRSIEEPAVTFVQRRRACTLGVGCDKDGACYAEAHGRPEICGRNVEVPLSYVEEDPAESPGIVIDESQQDATRCPFVLRFSGETHYDTREGAERAMLEYAIAIFRNVLESIARARCLSRPT